MAFKLLLVVVLGLVIFRIAVGLISRKSVASMTLDPPALGVCSDSPNCVSSFDNRDSHFVEAFVIDPTSNSDESFERLVNLISGMPRTRIVAQDDKYVHVVFKTLLMGYADDVEFLLDSEQGVVHVRSASRIGYSDLGANRNRVDKIRSVWQSSNSAGAK